MTTTATWPRFDTATVRHPTRLLNDELQRWESVTGTGTGSAGVVEGLRHAVDVIEDAVSE